MKQVDISELQKDVEKLPDGSTLLTKAMDKVMHESMLPYAEYVILDRALPRVEDGLKPVQRRILYSMYELGVTPDKSYRKSARIVGDCMGRYHPHGDSSIYDAMVRMAQSFSMSATLIDGQGNYGNVDGDSAAAMRYTEAKLTPIALELLKDIDQGTVTWSRNFDDTTKEPNMLPGRFPNLLVNGCSGIAVGLATNIPPHNLNEVIDGVVAYIDNRNISLKEMMKIIKGPDFPTGGYIVCENLNAPNGNGLYEVYDTGKGRFSIRAKVHIEAAPYERMNIVITELPYQVNKADLLIKIANLKDEKKEQLQGIAEIVDESDKDGMRAVIKLRSGTEPKAILDLLYKHTQMEVNFNANAVAIADGKPQQMGLLDIIAYYTAYQREVILKRCKYQLSDALEREHILLGLVIAVTNIDEVVEIIKKAESTNDAKIKLKNRFQLSDRQAQAILDLRLARITKLEVTKLRQELKELEEFIAKLREIINSKKEQMNVVKTEMLDIKRAFKTPRRSAIVMNSKNISIENETDEKPVENVIVAITAEHTIKKIPVKNYNMSNRESVERDALEAVMLDCVDTDSDCRVIFFSNFGNCYQCLAGTIAETKYRDKGLDLKTVFAAGEAGEYPIAVFAIPATESATGELLFFSRQGMVKRSDWSEYNLLKSVYQGYKGKDYDELISVQQLKPDTMTFVVTNRGACVKFDTSEVPVQGRVAGGVKAITLSDGEYVIFASQVKDSNSSIMMVTNKGFCKRLPVKEIAKHGRACKGAKGIEFSAANGKEVAFACHVEGVMHYSVAIMDRVSTFIVNTKDVSLDSKVSKGKLPLGKKGSISVEYALRYRKIPNKIFRPHKKKAPDTDKE